MGIGLILLLDSPVTPHAGCTGPALAKREPVLHYGHHGRYLFGDWIPAGVFVYPIIGYWQDTLPAAEAYATCG